MLERFIWATFLFMLAIALGGCVRPISGHRLDDLQAPIKKLNYVVISARVDVTAESAEQFHKSLHDLLIMMPQRIPEVFALNGVETGRNSDAQYEFVIKPEFATYTSYPRWTIETHFAAYIIDKSRFSKKVWEGKLSFLNNEITQINAATVDGFAKDILKQLVADGIVKLESSEIKVPAVGSLPPAEPSYLTDFVPVDQIQILSRFETVEVTRGNLGTEIRRCIPEIAADSQVIRDKQRDFSGKSSWATSQAGSARIFFVHETTAICIRMSVADFPVYAAEAFLDTVNPAGVSPEVLDVWYKKIANLIAARGKATVAYETNDGNAFVATYWVESPMFGLNYSSEFKKAGEWETDDIDAHFLHSNMNSVTVIKRSGRNEKMDLLSHRRIKTRNGSTPNRAL
jgi:hypothetical protein